METTDMQNPSERENAFSQIFASNKPKKEQVKMAVAQLFEMLDKPESPRAMNSWPELFCRIPGEQLAIGFQGAALSSDGFLKPRDIMQAIADQQFPIDYAWILLACRRHYKPDNYSSDSVNWRDVTPSYFPQKRIPGMGPDDLYPAEMRHPGYVAPSIPSIIGRALQVFGNGTVRQGLDKLSKHPNAGTWDYDATEELRIRGAIDREFRAAWQVARHDEMAGGK